MGSTNRSIVVALRTDATGVAPGFQETIQQSAQMTAQLKAHAESVAAAQQKLRGIKSQKPSGDDAGAMQAWQKQMDMAKDDAQFQRFLRDEHASTFRLKQQLDERYYSATLSRQELAMQKAQDYYHNLAAMHGNNAELMEKIDRTRAAQEAKIMSDGAGGGGGGFSQGWMKRMAGMEIGRDFGNLISPGMGDELGAAGYFGGGAMVGIGAAVVAVGLIAKEAMDVREGIKTAKEEQIGFNAEVDKSNVKWEMLAERTVKFSQFGEQARSQFESASGATIDAAARVDKAQIDFDYAGIWDHKEKAILDSAQRDQMYAQGNQFIAGIDLYGPSFTTPEATAERARYEQQRQMVMRNYRAGRLGRGPMSEFMPYDGPEANIDAIQAQMQAITGGKSRTDIELQYAQADAARAALEERHRTQEARDKAATAGMYPGLATDRARAEADYAAQQQQLKDQADAEQEALRRRRDQAPRDVAIDLQNKHIDKTTGGVQAGYDVFKDPAYQAQLTATQNFIDLEAKRTANEQKGAENRAMIEHDAAMARINLDQQTFDREQAYELKMAQIAGDPDPLKRRIEEQNTLNEKKLVEMINAGKTTDELWKQLQIMWQLDATLQREVDYVRTLLGIEHEKSATETDAMRQRTRDLNDQSAATNAQRRLEAEGMTQQARAAAIGNEHQQALAKAHADADAAASALGRDKEAFGKAKSLYGPDSEQAKTAWDAISRDQAAVNEAAAERRRADADWAEKSRDMQLEHERSVHNELASVLDATAVAESRMSRLQADRRAFEREHPDERSKAELDQLYVAKKDQLNADFERQMREKEIELAQKNRMITPYEADFMKLKMNNPDVKDSDLKKMAMLDQLDKHGDMSTRYMMGQTNFAMLGSHWSYGPPAGHGNHGPDPGSFSGGSAQAMATFDNARAKDMAMFDNSRAQAMGVFGGGHSVAPPFESRCPSQIHRAVESDPQAN
jgi:hypothetical protein